MGKIKVLMVDDDPNVLEFIENILSDEKDFEFIKYFRPNDALQTILKEEFHVIYLDYYMHPIDGVDLCNMIRSSPRNRNAYIIAFTSEENKDKQITIFESAPFDDFLTKLEISAQMFVSKLKAIVRREYKKYDSHTPILSKKNCTYNIDNQPISFTHTEFKIIRILAHKTKEYFSALDISELLSKNEPTELITDSTIRVHVKNIRNKLAEINREDIITTVPKKGYSINLSIMNFDGYSN